MVRSTGPRTQGKWPMRGECKPSICISRKRAIVCGNRRCCQILFWICFPSNRINSGQNPFEQDLKLAVTIQELIGEQVGGNTRSNEIPISLVLFTDEPLSSGSGGFRVMRISASYGHGEGVVGNLG